MVCASAVRAVLFILPSVPRQRAANEGISPPRHDRRMRSSRSLAVVVAQDSALSGVRGRHDDSGCALWCSG